MRIAIFYQRFLPEYGADRVHIEQARQFRQAGHEVLLFGQRFSPAILREFEGSCVFGPQSDALHHDDDTAEHVQAFLQGFAHRGLPIDVAIHGGWPYLSSIAATREFCKCVVFVDFGVVPSDGYDKDQVIYLNEVRTLRKRYLPLCDKIVSISNFIQVTQAMPDVLDATKHAVFYLGGNHVDRATARVGENDEADCLTRLLFRQIGSTFDFVILQLGRFEPGTYKSSEQLFPLAEFVSEFYPRAAFCYLSEISNVHTPQHLRNKVFALGQPSDTVLFEIMRQCTIAFSPSRWEGFNLPLLETQWLGKPCLALNTAAHPEVAWQTDLLCRDFNHLRMKLLDLLESRSFELSIAADKVVKAKSLFDWSRMASQYLKLFEDVLHGEQTRPA